MGARALLVCRQAPRRSFVHSAAVRRAGTGASRQATCVRVDEVDTLASSASTASRRSRNSARLLPTSSRLAPLSAPFTVGVDRTFSLVQRVARWCPFSHFFAGLHLSAGLVVRREEVRERTPLCRELNVHLVRSTPSVNGVESGARPLCFSASEPERRDRPGDVRSPSYVVSINASRSRSSQTPTHRRKTRSPPALLAIAQ